MVLSELIGQDRALSVIRRAVSAGRVPHAYLFEGPRGVGKHAAAIGLAMLLNCDRRAGAGAADPVAACGVCEPCRRIASGVHPDVVTVAAATAQIVMEQAKDIVTLVQRGPHEARARVVIIDDADRLNASAANALLKTLEEPAPRTHLVLLSAAPDRLLATIRSRTQRIRFRAVTQADLVALAARKGLDSRSAQVASVLADGRVGRFLELLRDPDEGAPDSQETNGASKSANKSASKGAGGSAGGGADKEAEPTIGGAPSAGQTRTIVAQLRAAATARGTLAALDTAAALGDKESKAYLPDALAVLARIYRDAIALRSGAPELALFTPATAGDISLPVGLPIAALGRALEIIVEADAALAGNVNAVMAVERLLIHLHRVEQQDGQAIT